MYISSLQRRHSTAITLRRCTQRHYIATFQQLNIATIKQKPYLCRKYHYAMEENPSYKKMYRSMTDRRIAGVCGGLGEYFNIDPVIIRIAFLVALLMAGGGGLLYLIMWIAVPEKRDF